MGNVVDFNKKKKEKQAFELLYNNSPINTNDFGILYEETYGTKIKSFYRRAHRFN